MPPLTITIAGLLVAAIPVGLGTAVFARTMGQVRPKMWIPAAADIAIVVWAWLTVPGDFVLPVSCALGWALVALVLCDVIAFRLPDVLTLPLIVAGLVLAYVLPERDLIGHAIAAVGGFATFALLAWAYAHLRGREGLGFGDAKLAGAAGAWLGWQALPSVVLVAALFGILWVAIRVLVRGRESAAERVPFGAPLGAAFWLAWLYGPLILTGF